MTTSLDWQARVGDVWAAEWRRTDRSFAGLAPHLDAAILADAPDGPAAVLDIGCGAGATSLALAAARPDLRITGVDLSPTLVAAARGRAGQGGPRFEVGNAVETAQALRPDLLVSRHGVMFFADPVAAFTRLHAAAAPGARLVFSCFRDRARNAFASELVAAVVGELPPEPQDYAPGPFAFASEDRVAAMLRQAGWNAPAAMTVDFGYLAGEGDDPVADAVGFLSRIGPLSRVLADTPDRAVARARLAAALARYRDHNRVVLPASAWMWRATKGVA